MNQPSHTEVRQALQAALTDDRLPPFDDALVAHVAGCAACRSALLLVTTRIAALPPPDEASSCAQIEHDVAAFIELEDGAGATVAAQTYPNVWWHLWSCVDCSETYALVRAIQAEAGGAALAALPAALRTTISQLPRSPVAEPTRPRVLHQIQLARSFLAAVFAPQPLLGIAHGDEEAPTVLWEELVDGQRVTVSTQYTDANQWQLLIEVPAARGGQVGLAYGDTVLHFELDARGQGHAVIPQSLLLDPDAPDLVLSLVLYAPDATRP